MTHPYREPVDSNPEILPLITDPPWYVRWWHRYTGCSRTWFKTKFVIAWRCDVCGDYGDDSDEHRGELHGPYTLHCGTGQKGECSDCNDAFEADLESARMMHRFSLMPRWK